MHASAPHLSPTVSAKFAFPFLWCQQVICAHKEM